ncbi:MAG: hypothetical protein IH944_03355 [Armatimonadetes bacterium]|nr:hypothetical protein [Armatimonadota bacterium]
MLSKTLALAVALFACTAFLSDDGLKRERGGEKDAAKDAMEGKAPPKLDMEKWMNVPRSDSPSSPWGSWLWQKREESTVPTWESMKGKVIILDFWAYW